MIFPKETPGNLVTFLPPSHSNEMATRAPKLLTDMERMRFYHHGFLSVSKLVHPRDIANVQMVIDDLFAREGREHGLLDKPLRLAPLLRNSPVYMTCRAIAKQLLGRTAICSFDKAIYKPPHDNKGTLWHQDQAGPGKFFPMNTVLFWFPLQTVTEENGCMRYESGSHRRGLLPHYRFDPTDPYTLITDRVNPGRVINCPLAAGDAVLHLPLTLHSAFPNTAPTVRRVWALLFRPLGRAGFLAPSRIMQQIQVLRELIGNPLR